MNPTARRSTLASVFLVVLVATAGCVGLGGQPDLPERETVADSLRSVDAIEATAVMNVTVGNETTKLRMDFVQRMASREFRATMDQPSQNGTVRMVSNGTTVWVYDESANTVTTLRVEGITSRWNRSVESISKLFGALRTSSGDEDVSISPLPVVPAGGTSAVGAASMPSLGEVSATYQGTATVDGRTAHVVGVEPTGNASLVRNGTIWFDGEHYVPIKFVYEMSVGGRSATVTVEYRNVSYNPSIADDAFTFEPPADATVTNATESISTHQTRSALANAAEQSLPDPDLPAGYRFAQGSTVANDGERSLTLQYSNGTESAIVAKQTALGNLSAAEGPTVDVAGHEAVVRRAGATSAIIWQCEGSQYQVTGPFSTATLRSIAESIACE